MLLATNEKGQRSKRALPLSHRDVETIAAYTDGVPTAETNQTTLYAYDGSGHLQGWTDSAESSISDG